MCSVGTVGKSSVVAGASETEGDLLCFWRYAVDEMERGRPGLAKGLTAPIRELGLISSFVYEWERLRVGLLGFETAGDC